uniref:Testis-expressed sequence 2 protein-like n=1 Tax=Phallusia mammillata TaxID=59560 RepID=A0A6F9DVA4_9ASCI|nr:testis-expressed sequence 2 protein-like [Phallusia mammillata]
MHIVSCFVFLLNFALASPSLTGLGKGIFSLYFSGTMSSIFFLDISRSQSAVVFICGRFIVNKSSFSPSEVAISFKECSGVAGSLPISSINLVLGFSFVFAKLFMKSTSGIGVCSCAASSSKFKFLSKVSGEDKMSLGFCDAIFISSACWNSALGFLINKDLGLAGRSPL